MTTDGKAAVASLAAAKDIPSLEAAIQAAGFLDNVPGDDRQKLRGAYTASFCHTNTKAR